MNVNVAVFALFAVLVFSYFTYFSQQLYEAKTQIFLKALEVDVIDMPNPLTFVTFTINNDFDYPKRKQTLLGQFISAQTALTNLNLTKSERVSQGKRIEEAITQIAFSYPFRGFITFNKDGTSTLNPNARSIQTTEEAKGIPGTNSKAAIPRNYDVRLLKQQTDEIISMNSLFTSVLKDGQENIIEAMSLARGLTQDSDKVRLKRYIQSLVEYLESHYRLTLSLGLVVLKAEFYQSKVNNRLLALLCFLLAVNFLSGIILPLFIHRFKTSRSLSALSYAAFSLGLIVLLWASCAAATHSTFHS